MGLDLGSSNPHPGAGRLPRLFSAGMLTKHVETCQLNSHCETLEGHVTVPEKHPDPCKAVRQTQARCVRGQWVPRAGPVSTYLLELSCRLQNPVSYFMESSKGHRGT